MHYQYLQILIALMKKIRVRKKLIAFLKKSFLMLFLIKLANFTKI